MTGEATRRLVLVVLAFLLWGGAAFAREPDLEKRVKQFTLKNGLKVLLVERHVSPTISCYIRHRVGAVDENDGQTGMAHLLEHMMFKGTQSIGSINYRREKKLIARLTVAGKALDRELMKAEKRDEKKIERLRKQLNDLQSRHKLWFISSEIDRLYTENGGVDANASTGQDLTTYHVSLPRDKIEIWARIESDRMSHPVFREFYTERDVVREERRQRIESDPEGTLFEQFFAAAFAAHPYRRPVLGWPSDIRFLDPDEMTLFFRRYHAPSNTVISVVGDLDPASVMKIIEKYFGNIPPGRILPRRVTEEVPQKGERRIEVLFKAGPEFLMGYHKPAPPSFDDYVFDVIDLILSKGRTSRLHKILVEDKKQAESVWTANGMPGARYPNLFVVFAVPRDPHTASEVEASIVEEMERLKREPVSSRELDKAKNQMRADYIKGLDSNEGLAGTLSYYESLLGDWRYFTTHIDVIEKITADDVMRVAKKYLLKENRTAAVLKQPS